MTNHEFYMKWKQIQYYVIIGVISVVALFFLPMLGSEAGLAWKLPDTFAGWIVYVVSKLLVATLNVLIFHCFILQGKVNINEHPKFIEANEILERELNKKDWIPKSPEEWTKQVYGTKGISVFVTSVVSAIGLTQAVLTFDWISMLTYFFTVLMGIIFGVLQMNQTEIYWTQEYWQYAKRIEKQRQDEKALELVEKDIPDEGNDSSDNSRGTSLLVSSDCSSNTSNL